MLWWCQAACSQLSCAAARDRATSSVYKLLTSTGSSGALRCRRSSRCACSARPENLRAEQELTCHDDAALPLPVTDLILEATCRASNPMSHPCAAIFNPHTACSGHAAYAFSFSTFLSLFSLCGMAFSVCSFSFWLALCSLLCSTNNWAALAVMRTQHDCMW